MPELGGSYFTFSNENNDLIWGFLAECHRRGWLYKGHDTMPWCARCGTGHQPARDDRGLRRTASDPGLTVRFPLLDRPGRVAARLDDHALDADLERRGGGRGRTSLRPGPPGRRPSTGSARARSRPRSPGPSRCSKSVPGSDLVGWRYARPVRRAARGPCERSPPAARTAVRTSTASSPGTRSARTRGPASSTSRPAAAPRTSSSARRSACRSSRRSTRAASSSTASAALVGPRRPRRRPTRSSSTSGTRAASTGSSRITHRYPHCWRCGTPLVFRLVDEWFISMGPVYDQPRDELTAGRRSTPSLRYQIMEVVDQIRWIPDFGYERELDWLLNMHDWMISKKRYWGLALPIYDCAACGDGRRRRRARRAPRAGRRGLGRRSRATRPTGRTSTR